MPQFQQAWMPKQLSDATLDDSDKSFKAPTNRFWQIEWVWVELISNSTQGNRQIVLEIQDTTNDVLAVINAGAVQAASLTRNYLFAPQLGDLTSFRNTNYLTTPIPNLLLRSAYSLRIYDIAAIAPAADDMVVHLMVKEYGNF